MAGLTRKGGPRAEGAAAGGDAAGGVSGLLQAAGGGVAQAAGGGGAQPELGCQLPGWDMSEPEEIAGFNDNPELVHVVHFLGDDFDMCKSFWAMQVCRLKLLFIAGDNDRIVPAHKAVLEHMGIILKKMGAVRASAEGQPQSRDVQTAISGIQASEDGLRAVLVHLQEFDTTDDVLLNRCKQDYLEQFVDEQIAVPFFMEFLQHLLAVNALTADGEDDKTIVSVCNELCGNVSGRMKLNHAQSMAVNNVLLGQFEAKSIAMSQSIERVMAQKTVLAREKAVLEQEKAAVEEEKEALRLRVQALEARLAQYEQSDDDMMQRMQEMTAAMQERKVRKLG